jgi:Nucleolin binding domain
MRKRPAPKRSLLDERVLTAIDRFPAPMDVDDLAEDLRNQFAEFRRQKAAPFRLQVERVLASFTAQGLLPPQVRFEMCGSAWT